jgi:glycosyltransferase involved in cell wall biosynthesis
MKPPKPSFSVVLIARNEANTLPRLVKSLAEFQKRGGDIIVVDTGSTDETVAIAKTLGCTSCPVGNRFQHVITPEQAKDINEKFVVLGEAPIVKENERLFDYAAARNYAASLSGRDFVFMPDCDEILTALDLDAIEKAIAEGAERFEYNFVFSHDEFGREALKFLHSKFYDRRKLAWRGIVHECLFPI